jgi:hypothetical protein
METIPYTYKLIFKPTGQYYYGVRYAKGCHPNDLWNKYFTSSKHVHKLIKDYGLNSFLVKITKTFSSKIEAIEHEHSILNRVKADKNGKFINKTNSKALFSNEGLILIHHPETKIQSYHDPELPIPNNWKIGTSYEVSSKLSKIRKGKQAHNKGKISKKTGPCSDSRKKSISESRKLTPKSTCEHCGKQCDGGNFKRFHGDNCKLNPNINYNVLKQRSEINKKSYLTQLESNTFNNFKPKIQ